MNFPIRYDGSGPVYDHVIPQTPTLPPNPTPQQLINHWRFVAGKRALQMENMEDLIKKYFPSYVKAGTNFGRVPVQGLDGGVRGVATPIGAFGGDLPAPLGYRSSVGQAWMARALAELVRTRQAAASLTPYAEIAVNNASAIMHGYSTVSELLMAANSAVQGNVTKGFSANSGVAAAANGISNALNTTDQFSVGGVNAATGTAGAVVFAWRVMLMGSLTNWAYRPIQVAVGLPTVTAGAITIATPSFSFIVKARRLPVDLIVLSVANGGGVFSVMPGKSSDILGTNNSLENYNICRVTNLSDANTFVSFESLNARDLLSRTAAPDTVPNFDGGNGDPGGMDIFPGIRDEALALP